MTEELVQGTEEWRRARAGSLGASRLHEAVARTKTGYGASRANIMAELICERLTGAPADKFVTAAMQAGTETEPEARDAYSFYTGQTVRQVGLIRHRSIEQSHASPDGLIGDDGMLEIKCPQPAAHMETLLTQKIPEKYVTQMMWQMACSGRKWVDYVSYNPSFPENLRLFIRRVPRDDKRINDLETEIAGFLLEMAVKLSELNSIYGEKEAA
ncbi:YqaJ viral recombinase family protein [Bradyrhizobium sp. 2]|uniref:lambda exonuclease family protein n=2 Tax=Bradyrhizobium sp. 2 TaxID=190045 RepID=UPI001FF74F51|nr:lambda exonuclease family protein [Bradyrhizobium sp. 2]MCK1459195.1 YqaJ viral recombinase family protein [Bradyrhizobium sp. 2]